MPSLDSMVGAQGSEGTGLAPGSTLFAPRASNTRQGICEDAQHLQGQAASDKSPPKVVNSSAWQPVFIHLPTEIHLLIHTDETLDPVSQLCLGLTNRHLYGLFNYIISTHIFRRIFDLRMQASGDSNHVLFGWWEYGYMLGETSVTWHRPLFELLRDEKLWGDLKCCFGCMKYKPFPAFETFFLESKLEVENPDAMTALQKRDIQNTALKGETDRGGNCRRCRAKTLLINVVGREEVEEVYGNVHEERISLGLIREGQENRAKELWSEMFFYCNEDEEILERWSEVFGKLGI